MPTNDLTRERRKLTKLKRRQLCAIVAEGYCNNDKLRIEARRMARELAAEIKQQALEVRRLALTGPWYVGNFTSDHWYALNVETNDQHDTYGARACHSAISWAERQNKKGGAK
jgi:hypothetical protein